MKRTTAAGNAANLYTEGNPSLSIPATVVGASEMNNIQEELAVAIEAAGIVLNGAVFTQLRDAILALIGVGGSQTLFTVPNNQASVLSVTNLLFNSATDRGAQIQYHILRETTTTTRYETGVLLVTYKPATTAWDVVNILSGFDDAEVDFTITSGGQIQLVSDNQGGASYVGALRFTKTVFKTTP